MLPLPPWLPRPRADLLGAAAGRKGLPVLLLLLAPLVACLAYFCVSRVPSAARLLTAGRGSRRKHTDGSSMACLMASFSGYEPSGLGMIPPRVRLAITRNNC